MRHCDAQREGKSIWFPNSGKVLGERFVLLFYVMLHCPSFNPLPLCLTFPALLPFILLPGNVNCCFFKGSLATWMDCMYISFKCGSTSMISWQRVCMCVVGRRKGGVFVGKGGESMLETRHGFNPRLPNRFTICFQTQTLKEPYYSDFRNWKKLTMKNIQIIFHHFTASPPCGSSEMLLQLPL